MTGHEFSIFLGRAKNGWALTDQANDEEYVAMSAEDMRRIANEQWQAFLDEACPLEGEPKE